ncbi:MAG: hypothetical protein P4M11_13980 [Candidatus Pacebacteria bacterium]|nr:hypothetical protein [Candidatus Paceibacterota bacterium]
MLGPRLGKYKQTLSMHLKTQLEHAFESSFEAKFSPADKPVFTAEARSYLIVFPTEATVF